jgi:hypothetical protein
MLRNMGVVKVDIVPTFVAEFGLKKVYVHLYMTSAL